MEVVILDSPNNFRIGQTLIFIYINNFLMNKKLIFTSLATTALLAACTSEELVPQANEVADVLASRPKIDVAFDFNAPATRMDGFGTGTADDIFRVGFTKEDQLGAVLVDEGNSDPAKYFNLVTSNTHIGNNRFEYKEEKGKFETVGTMCVGAWLFYAQYNKENTTSRGSIKYNIPVVQEYAQDFKEMAKNDFKFSPIVNLVGQEDGIFNYSIPTISAYTYANVKLTFPNNVKVQKLVLKPYSNTAIADGTNYDPFSKTYEMNMAGLKDAVATLNKVGPTGCHTTAQACLNAQATKLLAKDNYIQATIATPEANKEELIALNCLDAEIDESKEFQAYMLIPSGVYDGIRLYAYTDKGVYAYNINDENEAATDEERDGKANFAKDGTGITLKRESVSLHNIKALTGAYAATKAIAMTEVKTNAELQTAQETEGTVVISQKDLKAVIDGISSPGQMNVRVLGDMVKITKEIADAIAAKDKASGDIQLVFDKQIEVVGTTEGYDLTDITFDGGAKLTEGIVNIAEDINIPAEKTFTIGGGATLNVNGVANTIDKKYVYNNFLNNGTMNLSAENVVIGSITNNNTLEVKKVAKVGTLTTGSESTTTVNADLNAGIANAGKLINHANALNINSASTNTGTVNNNNVIHIKDVEWTNNGTISNAADAKIISGVAQAEGLGKYAYLKNYGTIDNYGFMYCYNGDNFIYNEGTINAKKGSTTYITRNSKEDEAGTETRSKDNVMGTINMETRNEDISVTSTNFQGYLTFTTDLAEIKNVAEDKFNKVILSNANAIVDDAKVKYVVTSGAKLTVKNDKVQELIFKSNCTLMTTTATVAYLEIAENKIVKLPTENVIAIENISTTETSTKANINNNGTLLVGGDLWSLAIGKCPEKGIFASGDGTKTAFHWGESKPKK